MGVSSRGVLRQVLFTAILLAVFQDTSHALPRTWIGGNVDWVDGGSNANWTPADEPDADDEAIFNTANAVNLGSNNTVNGLTMSGGIDLFTNNFDLTVDGLVQLTGAGTNLFIGGAASELNADNVSINGGTLELSGGTLTLDEESGSSFLDLNAGGTLSGNGVITFVDSPLAFTTMLSNDGTLTALSRPSFVFNPPPVGTLQINSSSIFKQINLDGSGEAGVVNVNRNQTLDINGPLSDAFSGSLNLFQNSHFDMSNTWTLDTGTITANNGFVAGGIGVPDTLAGTSFIAGATFTQGGGLINVVDTDGTLQFDAVFQMNGGTLTNNGHVIFNQTATIDASANFTMVGAADLTVEANRTVTINQTNFNLDGSNTLGTVITINDGGQLNLNVADFDSDSVTNVFDGTITISSGTFNSTTGDPQFVMDGVMNMNKTGSATVQWEGETLQIGNDAGALDADLNIGGNGNSIFQTTVDFRSDADVDIAAGCGMIFNLAANFNTVNGVNNAQFTGTGAIRFNGQANFNEAVTFSMTGGTVDFDGLDAFSGDLVNIDAAVTVNAATMEGFGKANTVGSNTLDINNSAGLGVLTVNLDNPAGEWTLNSPGVMNLVNDNTEATLLAGSDVNINGTVNVTGDVRTTARLDIAGTVNINTSGQPLRLAGGTLSSDPNKIIGGVINGAGLLGADTSRSLRGFGTINTGIDFDGTASLLADGGTLTVNGSITDVGTIGTFDADGTLHIPNAWNNNVSTGVQLNGGTLSGGAITNDVVAGISGHGLVTARVINNTQLFASIADSLIFQTAGNDNDWDGTTNTGNIKAVLGNIELRDNSTFGFTGTVEATGGHTAFTNGFALDFDPGSTLSLASGGTYESTNSTDLGGTVTIGGGAESTIKVAINTFLTFKSTSSTTLTSNLRLENNNINIDAGATFSGGGALVIDEDSFWTADNLADINVLVDNQGTFRPGGFDTIGRIDMLDYQQSSTGELFVELTGTSLNQFDRLVVDGDAILDGYLNIDIDGAFVPAINNTFNIITANNVSGTFDFADISGMPAGLTFHINYLGNAVQLQVVSTPFFSADFDNDGDVDPTDLGIWQGTYNLNQIGDADGDNDSDGRDFLLWQRQFGSAPLMALNANGTAVPEPNALVLLSVGLLLFGRGRVRDSQCATN